MAARGRDAGSARALARIVRAAAAVRAGGPGGLSQGRRAVRDLHARAADDDHDAASCRAFADAWIELAGALADAHWAADAPRLADKDVLRLAQAAALRWIEHARPEPFRRCCADLVRVAYAAATLTEGLALLHHALIEGCRARLPAGDLGLLAYRFAQRLALCASYEEVFRQAADVMGHAGVAPAAPPRPDRADAAPEAVEQAYGWVFSLGDAQTVAAAVESYAQRADGASLDARRARAARLAAQCPRADATYETFVRALSAASARLPSWAAAVLTASPR